jgi:DNA-binding transcriptional regulator YhcF (GntR family)
MAGSDALRQWVEGVLAKGSPGMQLPVDRCLAERFGVSPVTVRRILSGYGREGRLVRVRGKGTFLPGSQAVEPLDVPRVRQAAAEAIVTEIVSQVSRGTLRRGSPLPSYDTLCRTFGVSPNTVSRAMERLVSRGVATKVGKYYRVGTFNDIVRQPVRREICFFVPPQLDLGELFTTHEIALAFNKMENELLVHGHKIDYRTHEHLEPAVRHWVATNRYPQGIVLLGSYVASLTGSELRALRRPIVHLLDRGEQLRPRVLALATADPFPDGRVRSLSISHAIVMLRRTLARFLFEKGFRRAVCYLDETVDSFINVLDALRIVPEIDHIDPAFHMRFAVRPRDGRLDGKTFFARLHEVYGPEHLTARLSKYRPITAASLAERFDFVPDLPAALGRLSRPAAWIFQRDREGVRALDWCTANRVAVPRQLAIVSFDNDRRHYARGITACVRDWETMGYLMAHALIGDIPLEQTSRGFIAFGALMLERNTTP